MSCVNCGEQPRGDVLGRAFCSVHCADVILQEELAKLEGRWRRNNGRSTQCADEMEDFIKNE